MDSKIIQLFINLGLPKEVVKEIDNHLLNIYKREHHDKFKFYGFYFPTLLFPRRNVRRLYNRYRNLNNGLRLDHWGFNVCIKIYCNDKLRDIIENNLYEHYDFEAETKATRQFIKDHKNTRIRLGFDPTDFTDDEDYFHNVSNAHDDLNDDYTSDDDDHEVSENEYNNFYDSSDEW